MSNWRRWIRPGLATTILLAFVALFARVGGVERDLQGKVLEQLAADGHGWASVAVSGRSVQIGGTAPSPESQELAVQVAGSVGGVGAVSNRSGLLPMASPYVWSARRTGNVVTLSGSIPSEATRNSVLATARRALPNAEIRDETELARGAATGFNSATVFALDRLAQLADGLVTITDGTVSVSGVAATPTGYADARQALRATAPAGVTLGPVDMAPAKANPFVWSADYDGESITLAGYVPNEVVHETLLATARVALTRIPVTDRMAIASGEPEGFAEAASFALNALGRFREGGVMLDGLTLDIAGVARTVDDYEAVIEGLAGELPPGMTVVSNDIVPAPVSPYGWSGRKAADEVVLSGYVPSPRNHDEITTLARSLYAGLTVTDQVRIASGEPKMDWIGGIKFAMSALARLKVGKVELGDRTFAIEGEATTPEAFADLVAMTGRTLPASLELSRADVAPPRVSPYRFVAERGPRGVVLAGYAPNEKDKKAILASAERKFGSLAIVDRLAFASGAPRDFVEAASAAMQAVTRLAGGRAEIVDDAISIEGVAYYQNAADEISETAAESLPDSYRANLSIVPRQVGQPLSVEQCRSRLQKELQSGRVEFAGSKSEVSGDSFGLLDRVAAVLVRCDEMNLEVGAHSDSDGSSSRNRDLTQARAETVVDYLVDAGVRRERFTAVGYGETKPVESNASSAGKAANRRVEFTVVLPDGP